MMKIYTLKNLLMGLACALFSITLANADITENRAKVEKMIKDGNYKEALDLGIENFKQTSDAKSANDLRLIASCFPRLRKYDRFDEVIEIAEEKHAMNSAVLYQTGYTILYAPHDGVWYDNAFKRGENMYSRKRGQRGEYANSHEQDRVRALQYFQRAYKSATDIEGKSRALEVWQTALSYGREYQQSWKLQMLTDMEQLPEIERAYRHQSHTQGAPMTKDGDPVFYEVPATYEAAKNDGERWRRLIHLRVMIKPETKNSMDRKLAAFLHQQFSVRTLQTFRWYHRMANEDNDSKEGIMQIHTLKDTETIARLANTIKRFELPESQNYIKLYQQLWERGDVASGDQLVNIYLDRRMYERAATLLKQIIATKGDTAQKRRAQQLSQIVDDWCMFEQNGGAVTVGQKKFISMVYRNAKSVKLTVQPVDVGAVHEAAWKYLKSNPINLEWNKLHWSNLLHESVNGEMSKYVGESIAEKNYPLKPRDAHWDTRAELELPKIEKSGAYLITSELPNGKKSYTMIWVDDMVIVSRQVVGGTLFYVSDATTGQPIAGAKLDFKGYRTDQLKKKEGNRRYNILTKTFTQTTDVNGQVIVENNERNYRWAVFASKGEKRAWMGYNSIWSHYRDQNNTYAQKKVFGITSQPVYQPNSEVKGKFWVRDVAYDLGEVSKYAGKKFRLQLIDPMGAKVGKPVELLADEFGGVPFSYEIGEDAKLGVYRVQIEQQLAHWRNIGRQTFRVEQYKKPEYEVTVEAPKTPVQLGDSFEAKVIAKYYHGAPVTNAKVKVKVLRHKHTARWFPVGPWDWLYGSGYGWLDIERPWYPGWRSWGCKCPTPMWYRGGYEQPEMVLDEEFQIGEDGTVKVKIDSALAKLVHANDDHRYEIKVEVVDASRRTIFGSGSVLAARKPFNVTTWINRGYAVTGEKIIANVAARTLDGKLVKGTGTMTLKKVSFDLEGTLTEVDVEKWELKTIAPTPDSDGRFEKVSFQVNEPGQYRLVSVVKDEKGREIEGAILFTIRGAQGDQKLENVKYNDLELIPDKRTYSVGEKVKLLINTKRKDGVVMVFVKGTAERHFIKLDGHSKVLEIPVNLADMPNFFVEAMTISDGSLHQATTEIIVPPAKRTLNVEVLPSSEKYKPQEKGTVKIKVTDENGKPVIGECALTIYDKSLEYIAGGSNVAEIKSFFWKWRRHHQRGYWSRSYTTHGGNVVKKGSKTMQFLGAFGQSLGLDFDKSGPTGGAMMKNKSMRKSTAAPMALKAEAGGIQMEEEMSDMAAPAKDGKKSGGEANAGGAEIMVRKDFADLIKWSGSVKLSDAGIAEVPVEYPDNLTTWKIKTWAMSHGTRVGEGSAEVITSKDLIIRLQAPRFFLEKDEVVLSAIVHNYHDAAQQAKVLLELEGGTLDVISGDLSQSVELAAKNGEKRVNWRVKVKGEGKAIIRMKVITDNDSDAMEMTFPVYIHGMLKQMAWSREIDPKSDSTKIEIEVPAERRPADSRLEVRFSPTIAGSIVDALPYLAEYPYGCTEQTLNRFVPTVITQKLLKDMGVDLEAVRNKRTNLNPQEMGDDKERMKQWKRWQRNPVFSQKEVDKMVRQGVAKLTEMQLSDGGWGWFSGFGERSYPHTTAVVVHGLKIARDNGANIPDGVIAKGVAWLKNFEARETEKIRMWKKREKNTKPHPSTIDAFVRLVLAENGVSNKEMLGFQFRDKNNYGIYAKSLLGMSLHLVKDAERRDAVIRNIEQFLKYDEENQSAYLEMGSDGYWWYWYGSEFEAHAWYLKLLAATKPQSKQARGIVKYLINNRKHATYWNSTRDTAYCIEAIADYMKASGESDPEAEVEVLLDGKSYKKVTITKENLFSFDNKMTLAGDILTTGKHTIEIRRKGKGPLYTNAYLTVFTKEDNIKKAGLEVKVERRFYKLVPKNATAAVAGEHGQVVKQKTDQYNRIPLKLGDKVLSGDIIEVELLLESKNDYEYLMFSDFKAAGTEAEKVRSGYTNTGSMSAYMEIRDEKVCFFVRQLNRGKHSLTYRLRAEIPGKFSALPATADAMYAPELRANSDEMKLEIEDKKE